MNADISVENDDVSLYRSVDVEIAARDGDRSFDDGLRGDGSVAHREVVGVWQATIARRASLLNLFGDRGRVRGGRRGGFGCLLRIDGPGLRRCSRATERQCGECEQGAHCYARRRLDAAA